MARSFGLFCAMAYKLPSHSKRGPQLGAFSRRGTVLKGWYLSPNPASKKRKGFGIHEMDSLARNSTHLMLDVLATFDGTPREITRQRNRNFHKSVDAFP